MTRSADPSSDLDLDDPWFVRPALLGQTRWPSEIDPELDDPWFVRAAGDGGSEGDQRLGATEMRVPSLLGLIAR